VAEDIEGGNLWQSKIQDMWNGWMSARDIKRVEIVVYGITAIAAVF